MQIFGYKIEKSTAPQTEKSFVAPTDDGGVETIRAGGYYGTYIDIDGTANNEIELIRKYRDIAMMADIDTAIDDIVNDSIANLDDEDPVKLDLDQVDLSKNIKKLVEEEFQNVLNMLDFNLRAQDYFRHWYIDGRLYFHKVVDTANLKKGIVDVRYIDPRKIKKMREILKEKDSKTGVEFIKDIKEYFIYNERGLIPNKTFTPAASLSSTAGATMRIEKDSICFVPSGLKDMDRNMPLSYLHKAIRPANQLRMMENAAVIYRITRAPERRVFYVDVGNLPKIKAEQYLKGIMNQYRNKVVYDSQTGEIRDDKKFMSMLEDFWLPRREGGRGTEIDTLPGGQGLGEMGDIEYFQRKLYQALNVPMSRLEQQTGLNFGRAAEINRDEWKFTKFIAKLRRRFSLLFDDLLKTQLILKGIITEADWEKIKYNIKYVYATDAFYTESKEQQILQSRVEILQGVAPFIGTMYSKEYVQQNILKLSDDEIEEIKKQNDASPPEVSPPDYSPLEGQPPEAVQQQNQGQDDGQQ
jgi:hypothetical protein